MLRKPHLINFQITNPNFQNVKNSSQSAAIFNKNRNEFSGCLDEPTNTHNFTQDLYQISKIINRQPFDINKLNFSKQENCLQQNISQFFGKRTNSLQLLDDKYNFHIHKSQKLQLEDSQKNKEYIKEVMINSHLIPVKYINSLRVVIKQFLNFKLNYQQNQKRAKTACRTACGTSQAKHKNHAFIDKQTKVNFQNKKNQIKKQGLYDIFAISAEFQRQLSLKKKKIKQLQRELYLFSQKLKQKNSIIKQLQDRQNTIKVKFKQQFQKLSRGRNLFDIQNSKEQNQFKQNVQPNYLFKIHSKNKLNSAFKINGSQLQKKQNFQTFKFDSKEQSKSRFILNRQQKGQNNTIRHNKQQQKMLMQQCKNIKMQIQRLTKQKDLTLDKLSQNAVNMEKYIEQIQTKILQEKSNLAKYQQ